MVVPLAIGAAFAAPAGAAAPTAHVTGQPCVGTDNGAANPGPGCGPFRYRRITNSNGSNTYVLNDMWNPPGAGHPQTITVFSPGHWSATSDQARSNTAVLSYPDVQQLFTTTHDTPAPLSGFTRLVSHFTQSMPPGGDNEAAYDIWMGSGTATNYAQEVMIWVDDHRTNPPPGQIVARHAFGRVHYRIWQDPTGGKPGYHTIYVVRDHNTTSDTVNVLAILDWLVGQRLTAATGLSQVDFGWEICSTDGRPETFRMRRYTLRAGCRGGGHACWAS